jgi:protoheme IX farnesyltransferase
MSANIATIELSASERLVEWFKLLKFRLSFLVTFSAGLVYLLAKPLGSLTDLLLFGLGGFLVTGSANILNQVIERDLDKLMDRTKDRPLPSGKVSVPEALIISVLIGFIGLWIHYVLCNPLTFWLSLVSLLLYAFAYTPLKRVGPIAVFVGAFPGAFPPLIGWVAATGEINQAAMVLFGIQFIWQFPHFWAIAWVIDEDYKKAGFKLLPSKGGRDLKTAFNIMTYTLFLIPVSLFPHFIGLTGVWSAVVVTVAGVLFLSTTFSLMKKCDKKSAMKIMFGSFIYLPIVQIAYVLDKV